MTSPQKQIDHVLKILKDHQSTLGFYDIKRKMQDTSIVVEPSVLKMILEKLERDKYIYEDISSGNVEYNISFEGNLFIGYEKQELLDNKSIQDLLMSKQEARDYANRLLWATWSAGIFAGLLLLWQVFVYMYPHQSDWGYFWFQSAHKKP